MNRLPDDILYKIYYMKHQLEYKNTMDELLSKRIRCRYDLTLSAVRQMKYRNKSGFLVKCIELDNIDVSSFELIKIINKSYC
jgi:uncharacterized cysteine cluster protein YcgN (CxxCxxCC family)